jgi:hypothetical protein
MEKCACGREDWKEIGSTWLCMACKGKDYEYAMTDLKDSLERMKRAERALRSMNLDTISIGGLLDDLTKEVEKLDK